jgi:predicted ArsR family transcriptional regulator
MELRKASAGQDPLRDNGSDRHRLLSVESRRAVLQVLRRSHDELDAAQVAAEVGRHVTTVRQHLEALARGGVVSRRVERRTVRGRPRVLYTATSRREPDDGDGLLAMVLAGQLAAGDDPVGQAEEAGRRWGRTLIDSRAGQPASRATDGGTGTDADTDGGTDADGGTGTDVETATARVVQLLDEVGFGPVPQPTGHGTLIELHHCPFRQVATAHPEVACSLHLGLMRGALESLGAPVRADRLERFVTPTLCHAHLAND